MKALNYVELEMLSRDDLEAVIAAHPAERVVINIARGGAVLELPRTQWQSPQCAAGVTS